MRRLCWTFIVVALAFVIWGVRLVAADTLTVKAARANVRAGPGTSYEVLMTVRRGATFVMLTTSEGWYRIRLNDRHKGWIAGSIVEVTRDKQVLAVVPQASRGAPGSLYRTSWALVIGINRYQDTRIPSLRYAEDDAIAVQARLQALGFPANQIVSLLGAQATRNAIQNTLDALDRRMNKEDRLVVFAAARGVTAKIKGAESGFFLPYDATLERFPPPGERHVTRQPGNALALDTFLTSVSRLQPKHILVAMDACFSGFAKQPAVPPSPIEYVNLRRLTTWTKEPVVHLLTAGKAGECTVEHPTYRHGVFTHHLLRGLSGNADSASGNADGLLTFTELLAYVKDRVADDPNADQDPQYSTQGDGQFLWQLPEMRGGATSPTSPGLISRPDPEAKMWERVKASMDPSDFQAFLQTYPSGRFSPLARLKLQHLQRQSEPGAPRVSPPQSAEASRPTSPQPPTLWPHTLRNNIGMEFVLIQAGTFQMGSTTGYNDEKPVHEASLSTPFYLGKYEVTQGQWEAVMGGNPSHFTGDPRRPVEKVSWDMVQEFIWKLNVKERSQGYQYRLPTEAEWEYAARAGSTAAYSFGDDSQQLGAYAWSGGSGTHPVGTLKPNDWGLYDMHGNVWEWVQDWYDLEYYQQSPRKDPQGPDAGRMRVVRGGSFGHPPGALRSALRAADFPEAQNWRRGFRCIRVPPQP